MEEVGAVPQRAPVGDGAGGLQPDGSAWEFLPHDQARSKAYRWGEDGIAGFCDESQRLCFSVALWNGRDPILKERLFGLTGNEGNHGEDVKELYYYLDATPTHSYLSILYKYPQREFPYAELVATNAAHDGASEYELIDTGVFDDDRYFDVIVEYAKSARTTFIRITVHNRGPERRRAPAPPDALVPQHLVVGRRERARGRRRSGQSLVASIPSWASTRCTFDGSPTLLFTENETNTHRLCGPAQPRRLREGRLPRVRGLRPQGRREPAARPGRRRRRATG